MTASPDHPLDPLPTSRTAAEDATVQLTNDFTRLLQQATGLHPPIAAQFMAAFVAALREEYGGERLYIHAPDTSARDAAIRMRFCGTNLDEVCREFGVSKNTVYRATRSRPAV